MPQHAEDYQLKALDGRQQIKGMYETRWSSRADALNTFKFAHALIVDTLEDLAMGGDRNVKQLKLVIQDSGFIVALVVTEHVLQYKVVLSNLLQRPSTEDASDTDSAISSLSKIRQDNDDWQDLYEDIKSFPKSKMFHQTGQQAAGRQ